MSENQGKKKFSSKFLDWTLPFALGGFSGMIATSVIQPIDMIKVRIQIKSEELAKQKIAGQKTSISTLAVIKEIYGSGGIKTFYKG